MKIQRQLGLDQDAAERRAERGRDAARSADQMPTAIGALARLGTRAGCRPEACPA